MTRIAYIMTALMFMTPAYAAPPLLKGRIEHADRLPPVEQTFRAGATLDLPALQRIEPDNFWHRIPNWAGGTWHTETNEVYFYYDYRTKDKIYPDKTIKARGDETIGWQKDALDNTWEFVYHDYVTVSECNKYWSVHFVKSAELESGDDDSYTMHYMGINAHVAMSDRRIISTSQNESIQTYTLQQPGIIKCTGSIKTFDSEGNPISLQKNLVFKTRVSPYAPFNSYRGKDMRKLFAEYLLNHDKAYLLPFSKQRPIAVH